MLCRFQRFQHYDDASLKYNLKWRHNLTVYSGHFVKLEKNLLNVKILLILINIDSYLRAKSSQ